MLITSGHTYREHLEKYFSRASVIFIRNYGAGEPTDLMIDSISDDLSGKRFSRVFGIGGGTVLDAAKLFALKRHYPVCSLFSGEFPCEKDKRLVLVPTTCGTGSEVTNISILELTKLGTKKGLADNSLYADEAVLIPELCRSLPFEAFAASSADALVHAIESYLSPKATPFSETFSISAMRSIISGYRYVAERGEDAGQDIMEVFLAASAQAGIAFGNAGCAAVHALSYPLGAVCHCPHGKSNYIMLNGVLNKYAEKGGCKKLETLKGILSECLECKSGDAFTALDELMGRLLKKQSLSSFGLSESDLLSFTESVTANQQRLLANDPVALTAEDILDIYKKLY